MKAFTAITVTTLIAGLAMPALADDKFYPGTLCQGSVTEIHPLTVFIGSSTGTVSVPLVRPATYANTGAALNWSKQADMSMICPIVRDVVRPDGLSWNYLAVNVLNTSSSRKLTCVAESFFPWDYGFGSKSSAELPPLRDWTDLFFPVLSVPVDGYITVTCLVPRVNAGNNQYPSGIASYRVDE